MSANPILVEVYRDQVLESFHRGVLCMVEPSGKIVFSRGDVSQIAYPRSALKFFQHIPLIVSGAFKHFNFSLEELALMCGSHNGEEAHVAGVLSILEKIGLTKEALKCGAQFPTSRKAANFLIKNGLKAEAIHNNCSGKHAGFLAMAVFLGENPENYLSPNSQVQKQILKVVEDYHEYEASKMIRAYDGCSAPIFSIPVYNQALAYANLTAENKFDDAHCQAAKMVLNAVMSFPFMVAGTGRYCTDLMQNADHLIAGKTGAEGIYSIAFPSLKYGLCIKIDDGKMGPQYNVAQYIIEKSGLINSKKLDKLKNYLESDIINFSGIITGKVKVNSGLLENAGF